MGFMFIRKKKITQHIVELHAKLCYTKYLPAVSEMKKTKVSHLQESYKKCSLTQCSLEEICICQSNYFQFGINHIQSVLIQTAVTIHKSEYFLENAILLYSCISFYIYTHRRLLGNV